MLRKCYWWPVLLTNQLRFTQQMWQIERHCRGCSATCNCPLHDRFGRGLVIWTDLHADLHVVARAGLLWGNLVRRAVGFPWGVTISSLMWLECVSTFWMMKELMLLTVLRASPTLDRIKHLWERLKIFFFLVLTHIYVVLTSIFNNLLSNGQKQIKMEVFGKLQLFCVCLYAHSTLDYKGTFNTFTENLSSWTSHMEMLYNFLSTERKSHPLKNVM